MWQVDTVGDGVADTMVPLQRTASEVNLADTVAEVARRAELIDTTGDGLPDTLAIDTVGDGRHDKFIPMHSMTPSPPPSPPDTPSSPKSKGVSSPKLTSGSPKAHAASPKLAGNSPPHSSSNSPKVKSVANVSEGRRWSLADTLPSLGNGRWSLIGAARSWGGGAAAAGVPATEGEDEKKRSSFRRPARLDVARPVDAEPLAMTPMSPEQLLDQTPLRKNLSDFIAKHGLAPGASAELQEMMLNSCRKVAAAAQSKGPVCRWDQIHDMILANSKGTSLVIVNLPDPPELTDPDVPPEEQLQELVQYMEYMEGLAEGLPRALYVHGSGQEIINLEHNID